MFWSKIFLTPEPGPTNSKAMQSVANQSWYGSCGVSKPAAQSAQEALARDPRHNPISAKLDRMAAEKKK